MALAGGAGETRGGADNCKEIVAPAAATCPIAAMEADGGGRIGRGRWGVRHQRWVWRRRSVNGYRGAVLKHDS